VGTKGTFCVDVFEMGVFVVYFLVGEENCFVDCAELETVFGTEEAAGFVNCAAGFTEYGV
jgi:hypothetical protein